MKTIGISFTLKGQDQEKIFSALETIAKKHGNSLLVHGFLPRKIVEEKQFPTDVVDKLEALFPLQLNLWKEKPLRVEMAEVLSRLGGKVYVIGEVKEGVEEEISLYKAKGLEIVEIFLP
jgi:hypothetical protein